MNQMKSPPNTQVILNARMENEQGTRIEREDEVVGGLRQRDPVTWKASPVISEKEGTVGAKALRQRYARQV